MKKRSEIESLRRKIIGLGDHSGRKTYYLELRDRLEEVERKKTELEENNRLMIKLLSDLKESEQKYRGLVDNPLVGMFRSSLNDRFLYVNDALVKIFGCESAEELLSKPISTRYKRPEDREAFLEILKEKGKLPYYEIRILTPAGQQKTLATSAVLQDGVISGVNVDITEQKNLESQLRQAQKMEAIGVLAGGIAHDFNNILSAILGFAEVLQTESCEEISRSTAEQIVKAIDRAAQLTHSLLAFSRKQAMTISEVDLNDLITRLSKLLVRVIGEDIELRTVLKPKATPVMADSVQIEQIIMNLTTNARDAMPNGGTLTIVLELEEIEKDFCKAHGCETPGRYAVITVSDTGTGMDEETRKRIFDPFFTTKEVGKGTGLGLAMVYGIVDRHSGFLDVESEPGVGTNFKIYLPALESVETVKKETPKPHPIIRGKETILVAEDDPTLRELSQKVLQSWGYKVILAVDGEDAVAKFVKNKKKVSLVILDMIMPKMSGLDVYNAIKAIRPDIKALFLSGYTADKIRKEGILPVDVELAAKPLSQRSLMNAVRRILDSKAKAT
jgi:two-component system cell cycle sensor histidine kinase/response regulator CckA